MPIVTYGGQLLIRSGQLAVSTLCCCDRCYCEPMPATLNISVTTSCGGPWTGTLTYDETECGGKGGWIGNVTIEVNMTGCTEVTYEFMLCCLNSTGITGYTLTVEDTDTKSATGSCNDLDFSNIISGNTITSNVTW